MTDKKKTLIKYAIAFFTILISILGLYFLIFRYVPGTLARLFELKITQTDTVTMLVFTPVNTVEKLIWCAIQTLFLLPLIFVERKSSKLYMVFNLLKTVFCIIFFIGNALLHTLYSPTLIGKILVAFLSVTDSLMMLMPIINFSIAIKDYERFEKLVRIWFASVLAVIIAATLSLMGSLIALVLQIVYMISYKHGSDNFATKIIRGK